MSSKIQSDFNLKTVNTQELIEHTRATIQFGGNIFVVGQRGLGKTSCFEQSIVKEDHLELYWNLSTKERCDLGGYPDVAAPKRDSQYIKYLLPEDFKPLIEGNSPVVLLLDELDKCERELWAPLLELIQFHRINGRALPNLKCVLMTGNLPSEGGRRPHLPLLDRAEKYLLEPNVKLWLENFAPMARIHPSISAFVKDNPQLLASGPDAGDNYGSESPRGWENASKMLHFGEANKWSPKLLISKVSGCIGKQTGIRFQSYYEHYQLLLPIVDRIMNGEKVKEFNSFEVGKQMVCTMILCTRLANLLDDFKTAKSKDVMTPIKVIGKFLQTIDPEMALVSIRASLGQEKVFLLLEIREYDSILAKLVKQMKGTN